MSVAVASARTSALPVPPAHRGERIRAARTAPRSARCWPRDMQRRLPDRSDRASDATTRCRGPDPGNAWPRPGSECSSGAPRRPFIPIPDSVVGRQPVTMRVMLPAHRMAVIGMRMPRQPPAAAHMAVVPTKKEIERARKRGDEGDVRERPADEVVTAVSRPMKQVVKGREQRRDRA